MKQMVKLFHYDVSAAGSLDGVLTDAIVSDKVKFIQVILEQGVMMKEFLTFERLNNLYLKVQLT